MNGSRQRAKFDQPICCALSGISAVAAASAFVIVARTSAGASAAVTKATATAVAVVTATTVVAIAIAAEVVRIGGLRCCCLDSGFVVIAWLLQIVTYLK